MEVWRGTIASSFSSLSSLKGVSLIDPCSSGQCELPKNVKLSATSFIDPTLVPYYARTGPRLEVHVSDIETAEWLKNRFLGSLWSDLEDYNELPTLQCPIGILLGIDGSIKSRNITDVLVYGILSSPLATTHPPTPPPSSAPESAGLNNRSDCLEKELRIYAVPICTTIVNKALALPSPPASPSPESAAQDGHFSEFVPDLHSPSPKRKRMTSLFDAATEFHKRVKRKGGEAVAQLMAGRNNSAAQNTHSSSSNIKKEPERPATASSGHSFNGLDRSRPRALSISKITRVPKPSPVPALSTQASRPGTSHRRGLSVSSRRDAPGPTIRNHTPLPQSSEQPIPRSQHDNAPVPEAISINKALLTRTILTCMRLYGYHRNSKPSAPKKPPIPDPGTPDVAQPPTPLLRQDSQLTAGLHAPSLGDSDPATTTEAGGEDEDFKAMYHATYRASFFALRRYFKYPASGGAGVMGASTTSLPPSEKRDETPIPILQREKAMDIVDGVLKLFCEGD